MESDSPTGTLHGLVGYAHGPGVDQPVVVYRRNLDGQPNPLAVAPHGDWRGEWANGTLANYAPGTQTVGCSNSYGCPVIAWPGGQVSVDGELSGSGFAPSWWGSLVGRKSDGSRLQYLRNRYYDPETGRFTQEDPIGLAGGLNLYGFAGGDPVNFSDPFGLCKPWPECLAQGVANWGAQRGGVVGAVALNVGAGLNAASEAFGTNELGAAIGEGSVGGTALALAGFLPVGKLGKAGRAVRNLPFAGELADRVGSSLDDIASGVRRFDKDGTVFNNREGLLPDNAGGYYREYTVPGANGERGAQRIVTGQNGETYFTPDHYRTFVRIDP